LTIVAVFVPVAFMDGIVGQFFRQFGITVSAAVLLSLFVAFTLDPMLSSRFSKTIVHGQTDPGTASSAPFEAVLRGLDDTYRGDPPLVDRHKLVVGALAIGSARPAWAADRRDHGQRVRQPEDRGQFVVDIELPAGTSLEETSRLRRGREGLLADPLIDRLLHPRPRRATQQGRWRVVTTPKMERSLGCPSSRTRRVRRRSSTWIPAPRSTSPIRRSSRAPAEAPIMINVRGNEVRGHRLRSPSQIGEILRRARPASATCRSSTRRGAPSCR
jgi:HAE1 family hydrophobic/amphiphilic exporter-1